MSDLVIVKLGGSVITNKNKFASLNKKCLERLGRELSSARKNGVEMVIVHGAGSFCHVIAKKHGLAKGFYDERQKLAFAETHLLAKELNQLVCKELVKRGIPAVGLPALSIVRQENSRVSRFNTELVREVLREGLVPVLFGDVTLDSVNHGSICSGDKAISFLSKMLEPKVIVLGTDVDGVFTADPKTSKSAKLITRVDSNNLGAVLSSLEGSKAVDVTGGMKGKIMELYEESRKCPVVVVNALKPGRVQKALEGKDVIGTVFRL